MPKITKISPQKNSDRLNIYLDGEFTFGIYKDALLKHQLFIGKELNKKTIKAITEGDHLGKCLNAAYNYLSYRPRTEKEMREKLTKKFETNVVDKTISALYSKSLIDDYDFAKCWISERGKSRGKSLLKLELIQKGVSKDIISEILETIDDKAQVKAATSIVISKQRFQNLSKDELYKKAAPYLARRGYDYNIIKEAISTITKNDL